MDLWISGEKEMDMKLAMTATEDVFCLYKTAMYKDVCVHLNISTRPHHVSHQFR
jgi:hypothetical protein